MWFRRQAGWGRPEYRACGRHANARVVLEAGHGDPNFSSRCGDTGVNAATFYSDIVVPLRAIGLVLDIKPGIGPIVAEPIRSADVLARLRPLESDDAPV